MSELLSISFNQEPPDTEVVEAVGEIDLSNCDELAEAIESLNGARRVVIDLSLCTFFDSSCLSVLSRYAKKLRDEDRELSIRVDPNGRRIVELTNLGELLGLEDAPA